MKSNSLTVSSSRSREKVQVSNPFTWAKVHALVLKFRKRLPEPWQEILPVENVKDLKITLSLLTVFGALMLPFVVSFPIIVRIAYSSFHWNKKGGRV
ncbi:hypothetical protein [Parabacteroides sp. AM08-6]|uniref:hypothetical protein n=1 Tax=Parabacteroides sp. AM08-6 TaxID=2292053 RepID=UPI0011C46156|nr:hypothetical protein [Parabacteroides sp. AM08-6]